MKDKKIIFRIGTKGICCILFLIGLLCIVFSFIDFQNPYLWWESWGKSVSNTFGTTLIASGVVSLILEISNINSIFRNVLGNVLCEEFPLDAYSKENLQEFKNRISLYECKEGMKKEQLLNGIYQYEKTLLQLANSLYYEYHNAKYTIEPNEVAGVFKVQAKIQYKIINRFGDQNEMRFKIRTYAISEDEPRRDYENNFMLNSFKINGSEVDVPNIKVEKIEKEADSNYYDYKVKIVKDFGRQKNVTVEMVYTYNMPIDDQLQSYKVTLPCKRLEHQIKIKKDISMNTEWQIKTNAFTAFYYKQKETDSKFKVEQTGSDFTRIRYEDWIIPGGGYVLYFGKK